MRVRVGVKFCGSCNPLILTGELFRRIKQLVIEQGLPVDFGSPEEPDLSSLLVISACPHDCAERPAGSLPEVVVGGEAVNRNPCRWEDIPAVVFGELARLVWPGETGC